MYGVLKDLNHAVDLFDCVVKVEARASCAGHAEATHQRLVAMMATAHGQPVLIRERSEIMRMRNVHHKSNERAALFSRPQDTCAGQFAEALGGVARQLRV